MSGLGLTFLRRGGQAHPSAGSDYIFSQNRGDPEVFRILMSKGVSSDGVGITKEDAARVTSVGDWFRASAISNFDELCHFTSVTHLEDSAFRDCSNLKSIDLTNIRSMGLYAFMYSNLSEYDLYMPNLETLTGTEATKWGQHFIDSQLRGVKDTGKVSTIVGTVSGSVYGMFSQSELYKSRLEAVHLNSYVRVINPGAFFLCTSLRTLTIDEGLTKIDASAFGSPYSLESVTFPSTLSSIGQLAFYNAKECKYMKFLSATPPSLGNSNAFATEAGNNYPLYVPDESVDAYKAAPNWSALSSRIKPLSSYSD